MIFIDHKTAIILNRLLLLPKKKNLIYIYFLYDESYKIEYIAVIQYWAYDQTPIYHTLEWLRYWTLFYYSVNLLDTDKELFIRIQRLNGYLIDYYLDFIKGQSKSKIFQILHYSAFC